MQLLFKRLNNEIMEENTIQYIEKLESKCKMNKDMHFIAANRFKSYNTFLIVSIMLINLTIAVAHLFSVNAEMPVIVINSTSVLSLIAVFFAGFELRFDYSKKFEGHRRIGNKYLELSGSCGKNIAIIKGDKGDKLDIEKVIDGLNRCYTKINKEAEGFPISQSAFKRAKKNQKQVN